VPDGVSRQIKNAEMQRALRSQRYAARSAAPEARIEGASGPQSHHNFIAFSYEAPLGDGYRAVAGAREDEGELKADPPSAS